ncbi:MAG: LuxR C-terminal-related transcriptional regulator [Chitinophagales bacterium]
MKENYIYLDEVFSEFDKVGVDLKRMNESDIDKVKSIVNQKEFIVWITDYISMSPFFINSFGANYYGFNDFDIEKKGNKLYQEFMHPDHYNDVHKTIAQLTNYPNDAFEMTYRVKNKAGEWRWTYSLTKTMTYKSDGQPKLVIAFVYDIGCLLNSLLSSCHSTSQLNPEHQILFDSLSEREVEVLKLIAEEKTSNQIGEDLNIAASTVNGHKNSMIKKLGVKNSFGLMKYATIFNL